MSLSAESPRLLYDELATPLGTLALVADHAGCLRSLGWTDGHARMARELRHHAGAESHAFRRATNPGGLTAALGAYFAGDLTALAALPVVIQGTDFQCAVWNALRTIPLGETLSYGALARRIGRPSAVRAVGLANGANPIAIVVPCHRVIGADGSLTGYGGGLDRKRWLLAHERSAGRTPALPLFSPAP
jgi:methylated-DNA-[protein]-cysteine S-methyltransferase